MGLWIVWLLAGCGSATSRCDRVPVVTEEEWVHWCFGGGSDDEVVETGRCLFVHGAPQYPRPHEGCRSVLMAQDRIAMADGCATAVGVIACRGVGAQFDVARDEQFGGVDPAYLEGLRRTLRNCQQCVSQRTGRPIRMPGEAPVPFSEN
jgi:hypothetical protein